MMASVTLGEARRKADSARLQQNACIAKSCVSCRVLQHFLHQTLRNLRGVCTESVGRNTSEANGFALTLPSFTESMWVGESAYFIPAFFNIFHWRLFSSSENQGHGTADGGSHNPTSTNKLRRWRVFFLKTRALPAAVQQRNLSISGP